MLSHEMAFNALKPVTHSLLETVSNSWQSVHSVHKLTIALAIVRMSSISSLCLKCPCFWMSAQRLQLLTIITVTYWLTIFTSCNV